MCLTIPYYFYLNMFTCAQIALGIKICEPAGPMFWILLCEENIQYKIYQSGHMIIYIFV